MARLWYGGASADFVVAQGGEADVYALDSAPPNSPVATEDQGSAVLLPLVGTTFDVYTDAALTVLTTSLLNASGGAITDVTSETDFEVRGTIPRFQGPDGHEGPLWLSVDAVIGYRLEPESSPLYTRVSAVEVDVVIAQTDISDATVDLGLLDSRVDAIEAIAAPVFDKFIADGTWVKPAGARKVFVECLGGGGGGGGCAATGSGQAAEGGGGGGGGFTQRWLNAADLPSTVPVVVGAGGTVGSNANGGSGGDSSFGSPTGSQRYLYASGADGGAAGPAASGSQTFAIGGNGYSGDADLLSQVDFPLVISVGGDGGHGAIFGSTNLRMNCGGSSRFRGDLLGSTDDDSVGGQASQTGGGGSGARNAGAGEAARAGGVGGAGFVQVTTFF